jgi:putative DNA primase/helicase
MVLPPESHKDFRAWRDADNITADDLLAWVADQGKRTVLRVPLSSGAPLAVAGEWLRATHWQDDLPLLRTYQGAYYQWTGQKYKMVADVNSIRGQLYEWLDGRRYEQHTDDGNMQLRDYEPTRSKITDLLDALSRWCPVDGDAPCWLNGKEEDPANLICFPNGVLDVEAYLAGKQQYLAPSSPALFATTCLPYDFDETAKYPLWQQWCKTTFGEDEEAQRKIALLQEWYGYCMTTDMSMEKLLLLIGQPRSGKGTALEMLRALLGKDQVATTKFATLANAHGLEPLIGKLAAIMPDARIPQRMDSMQALETLLAIVGGDGVDVNPKRLRILPDVKLTTRFTVATNLLPELPDYSHALESRLIALKFSRSFRANPDRSLKRRLPREAPGVATWALEGLRRLREQGDFTEPESSGQVLDDFRRVTSPVTEFVSECCYVRDNATVEAVRVFQTWQGWCNDRGLRAGHKMVFEQRLLASCPGSGVRSDGRKKQYTGIELDPNMAKEYGI